ncbi:MAG: hypothetical protein IKS99_07185 [Firmicutes bacterium]|nr:hypothetical protein [Bacillota bacterium]
MQNNPFKNKLARGLRKIKKLVSDSADRTASDAADTALNSEEKTEAEKKRQRQEEIKRKKRKAVRYTGWTKEELDEKIAFVKKEYGISTREFLDYFFYRVPEDKWPDKVEEVQEGRIEEKAKKARQKYFKELRSADLTADETHKISCAEFEKKAADLSYVDGEDTKQPDPIIAACWYLGRPLPNGASMLYQPSAYIEPIDYDFDDIRKVVGEDLIPDTTKIRKDYNSFTKRFKKNRLIHFNNTDLAIFFTDYIMHCKDQGYEAADYFDYFFYLKEFNVRKTFLSNDGYRKYIARVCLKNLMLFKNKARFDEFFADEVGRDNLDATNCSFEDFKAFTERNPQIFVKPVEGTGGEGAAVIDTTGRDIREVYDYCQKNGMIVEEVVRQHEELAKFNPDTVNTTRVYSLIDADDEFRMMAAFSRFGRKGRVADNFHQGGMVALLDTETGVITTDAVDRDGIRSEVHPDSGVKFKGFQFPEWDKVVETIKHLSYKCKDQNRHMGWDITVDRNGRVILIEGNSMPKMASIQTIANEGKMYVYERYMPALAKKKGVDPYVIKFPKLKVSGMQTSPLE